MQPLYLANDMRCKALFLPFVGQSGKEHEVALSIPLSYDTNSPLPSHLLLLFCGCA